MELKEGFSDMENSTVIDANKIEIGKIIDYYFTNDFMLEYFVIERSTGSRLLVHKHDIESKESTRVYISKTLSELSFEDEIKSTLKDHHRFTVHRERPVMTVDGHIIGKIMDSVFHADDHISFMAGKHRFRDVFRRRGISGEHQIVIPYRYIVEITLDHLKISEPKSSIERQITAEDLEKGEINLQKMVSNQTKLEFMKMMR